MAIAPSLVAAVAGAAIAGAGNGTEAVAVRTLLQEEAQEGWMALVMSFTESVSEAVPGAGIALGGAIAALAGARAAIGVTGVASLGIAALVWVMLRPTGSEAGAVAPAIQANDAGQPGFVEAGSRGQ